MTTGRFRRVGVIAVAAGLLAAGCSWGQYGHDASRAGWSPAEDVITPANVASLAPLWRGPATTRGARLANGLIYSIEGGHTEPQRLVAYDAAGVEGCSGSSPRTCTPRWSADLSVRLNGFRMTDGIAVDGDRVYVVGSIPFFAGPWRLAVFDARGRERCSGVPVRCAPLWVADWGLGTVDSIFGPRLAVAEGRVYVSTPRNPPTISAFDANGVTGCVAGPTRTCSSLFTTSLITEGGLAVGAGKLVVDYADGVAGFDAAGQQGCSGQVCNPLFFSRTMFHPSIANGHLYGIGSVFDLSASAGCLPPEEPLGCSPTWSTELTTEPLRSPPVVAAGRIYVGEQTAFVPQADVEVFDAAGVTGCQGEPKVCQPQARLVHGASTAAVAATKSLVFVATARTGAIPTPGLHAFALADDIACEDTVPRTCAPLWSAELPADVGFPGPISIANGIVVVADDNGGFDVFALRS
jgi:hypothetical protein